MTTPTYLRRAAASQLAAQEQRDHLLTRLAFRQLQIALRLKRMNARAEAGKGAQG